jgi:hypothetical protein
MGRAAPEAAGVGSGNDPNVLLHRQRIGQDRAKDIETTLPALQNSQAEGRLRCNGGRRSCRKALRMTPFPKQTPHWKRRWPRHLRRFRGSGLRPCGNERMGVERFASPAKTRCAMLVGQRSAVGRICWGSIPPGRVRVREATCFVTVPHRLHCVTKTFIAPCSHVRENTKHQVTRPIYLKTSSRNLWPFAFWSLASCLTIEPFLIKPSWVRMAWDLRQACK